MTVAVAGLQLSSLQPPAQEPPAAANGLTAEHRPLLSAGALDSCPAAPLLRPLDINAALAVEPAEGSGQATAVTGTCQLSAVHAAFTASLARALAVALQLLWQQVRQRRRERRQAATAAPVRRQSAIPACIHLLAAQHAWRLVARHGRPPL